MYYVTSGVGLGWVMYLVLDGNRLLWIMYLVLVLCTVGCKVTGSL